MTIQMASIIREGAGELAECWAREITTCLGVDLSPDPSREDPQLLTGVAAYLDPRESHPAALLQLSRRARDWGGIAELRGIEESTSWTHTSYSVTWSGSSSRGTPGRGSGSASSARWSSAGADGSR